MLPSLNQRQPGNGSEKMKAGAPNPGVFDVPQLHNSMKTTPQDPITELQGHAGFVNACAFSFDWIATASDDCTVRVWPKKRKTENALWDYTKILHHDDPVASCAFASDFRTLYTVTRTSSIVAWKVTNLGELLH